MALRAISTNPFIPKHGASLHNFGGFYHYIVTIAAYTILTQLDAIDKSRPCDQYRLVVARHYPTIRGVPMQQATVAPKASSAGRTLKLRARLLFTSVCLGHISNDIFMSMGPVVLTYISLHVLPLSSSEIGTILGLVLLLNALAQPLFGWLADQNGGRWIGAGGVAWTLLCTALAMLGAETGAILLFALPFVLRALGSSAFHPVGAMHAAESNRQNAGVNLALSSSWARWAWQSGQLSPACS